MADYKPFFLESENLVQEEQAPQGGRGERLYRLDDPVRWNILGVLVYAAASVAIVFWTFAGPSLATGKRVLRTGELKVDQFYSGLALSAILAPAGIMIRRISNDLALLHPFALASKRAVRVADLDRMMDPGIKAAATVSKYSFWFAAVQAILIITGALIVPIGTLLVTTGEYASPTKSTAVVGLPTSYTSNTMTMSIEIGCASSGTCTPTYDLSNDFFMEMSIDMFRGTLISQSGYLSTRPNMLGPIATSNITFEDGVTYGGIVTYGWDSGCEPTDEITYTSEIGPSEWMVNFTFPNGQTSLNNDVWDPFLILYSDSDRWVKNNTIPLGGNTYFAVAGSMNGTASLPSDTTGLDIVNQTWISRVKCSPVLEWQVSSCTWSAGAMVDCTSSPGGNTTTLDTIGLDALNGYLTAIPWAIQQEVDEILYGNEPLVTVLCTNPKATSDHQNRAPGLIDYHNLYGAVAQSLATVTTAGYYGTAEVPTTGSAPKRVYIVRTYILAIVVVVLFGVSILTTANLAYSLLTHLPLRRATLLTVANAIRGPWWDIVLWGGCTLSPPELRKKHQSYVMFGVDVQHPQHIGLAPDVYSIARQSDYCGVSVKEDVH